MTDEQIKQNAHGYTYTNDHNWTWDDSGESRVDISAEISDAYIAGAHSMLSEVDELKGENKYLKEALSTRNAEIVDMEFLRRQDKELLNNAVSMLKDIYEDDDYFCTRLLDIPEEEKICEIYCDKEGVQCDCILRYLKHYKKGE